MDDTRLSELSMHAGWTHLLDGGLHVEGSDPILASRWPMGELCSVALGRVAVEAARLSSLAGGDPGDCNVSVNDAACALVGFGVQRLDGEVMPRNNAANPFVGRYLCGDDRWIFLHGGFPGLVDRLSTVLNLPTSSSGTDIERVVRRWHSADLEDMIARESGCSAVIRTVDEWRAHPHGSIVHESPLVIERARDAVDRRGWEPDPNRPLAGLRVLDLTRVLAGPTCGRTLASLGADVLHVRGARVPSELSYVIDTGQGKRQAHADFADADELASLIALACDADVVVQGYRPGVAVRHGLDEESLRSAGFTGVYGSLSAFGSLGPWSERAGWEQLAQSVSGLCGDPLGARRPEMPPAAVTDYTTGFVLAGAIVAALADGLEDGCPRRVEASLCQTAAWLVRIGDDMDPEQAIGASPQLTRSHTEFGALDHLGPGFQIAGIDIGWERPSAPLGSGRLTW